MTFLRKYRWEVTHIMAITAVITGLALGSHLFGSSPDETPGAGSPPIPLPKLTQPSSAVSGPSAPASQSIPALPQQSAKDSQRADPHEVTVGPSGISNRYTLLSVRRRAGQSNGDELIIKLHVESLATETLVSPFGSDMLDINSPGLRPITPSTGFHQPIPSGESRNREIAFNIPPSLSLNQATLRIHYYNYESEIPLSLPPDKSAE